MSDAPILIKVGGHQINDHDFLTELAATVRDLAEPVALVHGGGTEISELQTLMGIEPRYIDGVRITDPASLTVVEMVLCGVVNTRLVRYLVSSGIDAIGLSGVDRGLVRAVKMNHADQNMERTGAVTEVRGEILKEMLAAGLTPVIAPVCLGSDDHTSYNVNADHVAGAAAGAIHASRIVFLTNVDGVLVNGERAARLDRTEAEALIHRGVISGGMIPKVRTAFAALQYGVPQAVITSLSGLKSHGGTVLVEQASISQVI
jgi:acetylglutamate kinase